MRWNVRSQTGSFEVDNLILAALRFPQYSACGGVLSKIMSLLSWIAALLVSRVYSVSLASILENLIDNPSVRYVIAFSVLFVIIIMLGTLLNHLMSKLLVVTGLKTIDRLLGAVFGVARGTVIVLVFLFVLNVFVSGLSGGSSQPDSLWHGFVESVLLAT